MKNRRIVTASQMREMDQRSSTDFNIPTIILMENAGRAVFDAAVEILGGDARGKRVLILCGPGNNGGDGFVVARYLHQAKAHPIIAYYGDRETATGDASVNTEIAYSLGIEIHSNPDCKHELPSERLDLIIDALLGTGAKGLPRDPMGELINRINEFSHRLKIPTLAVDIPSGVDADTGEVPGEAIDADVTVTFAAPKIGLAIHPGASHVGRLIVADIGIPASLAKEIDGDTIYLTGAEIAAPFCRPRPTNSHKGNYGHAAIVAGSVGMTGAAALAAAGAMRIGTGLVTVLVCESLNDIMQAKVTEAMTIPVPQGRAGGFGAASLEVVLGYINKWDAAIIGPGFGRDDDTIEFTHNLIRRLEKPAVIDADALYAVSKDIDVLKKCHAPLTITPHPGEMAELTGTSSEQVQSNRLKVACDFADTHNVTVALKGAGTIIASPGGKIFINTTGSPGMATGGTGDVLSGMIGGLLAQKVDVATAAVAAVYLHGLAGEIAAERLTEPAMLAGDLADAIGDAIKMTQAASSEL